MMNPSFNIDWQKLRGLVGDLDIISHHSPDFNFQAKLEMTKLIYLIEKDLAEIKNTLNLPLLNPNINSASVEKGFDDVKEEVNNKDEILEFRDLYKNHDPSGKSKISFWNYFRPNDLQYWLLIFLLLKNNEIRSKHLSLYKIIDQFIERVKDESFNPGDIELTGSGATRCKTNLRFAFDNLKDLGLVYLYDKNRKNSWTLTFIGFFAAASFCFIPADERKDPLGRKITQFNQSTFYFRINLHILNRIDWLSDPQNFKFIVRRLKLESLGLEELEKGPRIFASYYDSVNSIFKNEKNNEDRMNKLCEFLNNLNEEYPLDNYMDQLSLKFKAEEFFQEVTKELREE